MGEEVKTEAAKEVERIKRIMKTLKVVDRDKAASLVEVLESYYSDCLSFYKKGRYLQALEAAFIVWAYVDAGLHLGVFEAADDIKDMFTV